MLFQMVETGMIPSGNRNALVFGTFLLLFLGTGFLYFNKHFNLIALFKKPAGAKQKRGPPPKTAPKASRRPAETDFESPAKKPQSPADKSLDELALRVKQDGESDDSVSAGPKSLDDDGFDSGVNNKADESQKKDEKKEKKDDKKDKKKEAAKKKEDERRKKEAEQKAKEEEKRKAAEKKQQKSPADAVKPDFLKFLTDAVTAIQAEHPQLNTFSKFGMNLYMCGACSTICSAKGLSNDDMHALLIEGLGLIGTNAARAKSFCDEIPTYGGNPRYAGMIQSGSQAISNFMGGQSKANSGLSALLTEWNLPEKRPSVPNMFTFLFTDIVGSTAMTQRLGNVGAQKAVRAHNDAVRGAIQQFNGREVKHTGDGIMATFPDGPSAVGASIQMLQGIQTHNQADPQTTVEIRIGINTGEAVEEENDFFGQAVQTTARICDKAADGHAWVSEVVVEACKGQRYKFLPRGEFEMKGLDKPKPLFEIAWTDAHRDELADL
jgi:adenylate cyclase